MKWVVIVRRDDSKYSGVSDLRGKTFGITKLGGGSHINTVLIANKEGWSEKDDDFVFKPLGNINSMISALKNGEIDCFVWEPLSIKSHLDKGDLKVLAEAFPPWPSFMIASKTEFLNEFSDRVRTLMLSLQEAARIFDDNRKYPIEVMNKVYNLSEEDCRDWLNTVRYSTTGAVSQDLVNQTTEILVSVGAITREIGFPDLVSRLS
jgi:ABC-type nitrate/sulfonate/bicarbonate transport system substrate-binding protein